MGIFKNKSNLPAHAVPAAHGVDEGQTTPKFQGTSGKKVGGGFMSKVKSKFKNMYSKKPKQGDAKTSNIAKNEDVVKNGDVAKTGDVAKIGSTSDTAAGSSGGSTIFNSTRT